MNLRDFLAQTLVAIERSLGEPGCQITLHPPEGLGRLEGEPAILRQALALLIRGAFRTTGPTRFSVGAERFTDDVTGRDWAEISVHCPAAVTRLRQEQVEATLRGLGGRLDLESSREDGECIYRIYVPCLGVLVPFPA